MASQFTRKEAAGENKGARLDGFTKTDQLRGDSELRGYSAGQVYYAVVPSSRNGLALL